MHSYVERYDGITYSLKKAAEYARAAEDMLETFEENEALNEIKTITKRVLNRRY